MPLMSVKTAAGGAAPDNAPRRTLRPGRYYSLLAFRTALWTSLALGCFVCAFKEGVFPAGEHAVKKTASQAARPAQELPMAAVPSYVPPQADSLSMVKAAPGRSESPAPGAAAGRGVPRLASTDPGRWFAQVKFRRPEAAADREEAASADAGDGAVSITREAFSRKIKVRGGRPVSAAAARRYASVDKEAEQLRASLRARTEAAEAARKKLLRERLELAALILALAAALTAAASRLISAWRSIHRPDGPHWTLK